MTDDQTLINEANALLLQIQQQGSVNIGSEPEKFRPLVEILREAGHNIGVGPFHAQSDGKKTQFVGMAVEESATTSRLP